MHGFGLLRRRRSAGPDRPYRLIRDDRLRNACLASTATTASSCRSTTASVAPASRSASVSPTQTIGVKPAASAASALFATVASVSPYSVRRSEWPTIATRLPNSATIAAATSPVNAPETCSLTVCAPQSSSEPDSAA